MEDGEGLQGATTTPMAILIATAVIVLQTALDHSVRAENTMTLGLRVSEGPQGEGDSTARQVAPAGAGLAEREE